jgi:glycosyltransferase involved in cell wall biosynthesis
MKPIAIFIDALSVGGAEKVAATLANELAARGHPVDLLTCRSSPQAFELRGVRTLSLQEHKTGGLFASTLYLARYLRNVQPAALFAFLERPSLLAIVAALLAGYRKIIPTVHIDLHAYARLDHQLRRNILRWLVRVFYPFAACIVAVSEGVALSVREITGYAKVVHVIKNGFDLAQLQSQATQPVRFAWLDKPTLPVIVACGRLVPQKGFDTLLRAFARLQPMLTSRLVILGEGWQRYELQALAHQLGVSTKVAMPGIVAAPVAWFAKANLFVLSSRAEGLSNVLTEAMIAGVPIVSTDCPSGPADVLAGGHFGQLVPVDDVDALAAAMRRGITTRTGPDPARARHLDYNFSLARMVDGYLRIVALVSESPWRNATPCMEKPAR